jgi:UDP-N-acetylmuramoyl-tripeptide--D-alanyl-D-alanine ligase
VSVRFTVKEIATAVGGTVLGTDNAEVCGVSTDSRTVTHAELFIPLRGDRFDGHDFIAGALERGVKVFMAERSWGGLSSLSADVTCIIVDDTLRALGDLAAFHRNRFTVPIVAVTGSNGKTTTKEMLAAILDQTGRGLKTAGNLNNLIGLPLMLLQLGEEHRWVVLEMGMSEPGEVDRLAEIARPQVGIVTNVAPAHLESMGTVEAVAKAKGELLQRLQPGCSAIINGDDNLVAGLPIPDGVLRITFGFGAVTVRAEDCETLGRAGQSFVIAFPDQRIPVSLKVFGRHNIANALAAATAAQVLGVAAEVISRGLASFVPVAKRFAPEDVGGIQLVDDSYNANPASVRAALETLAGFKEEGRGIAVLGDMLELGEGSRKAHEEIGRLAATCVERLYVFGAMATAVAEGAAAAGLSNAAIIVADDHGQILDDILAFMVSGDCVLVKGSRGMRMETVAEGIRAAKGGAN